MNGNNVLSEVLKRNQTLNNRGITFIEGSEQNSFLSYGELYDLALEKLCFLQNAGIRPKEELVFQVDDNKTFVILFWACILGGIIPIPLAVGKNDEHKGKLFRIWSILTKPHLISTQDHLKKLEVFALKNGLVPTFDEIKEFSLCLEDIKVKLVQGTVHNAEEDDIAFIQFSSGSTGEPKGVILSHKNLLVNMTSIGSAAGYSEEDTTVSWMPLTHDMGLIGFHLNPLLYGMDQCLIPTELFVRRPSIWLEVATRHRASVLCSPNFGYKYLLKYCKGGQKEDWDLSHVRVLYNGAEPISVPLCHEFLKEFSKYKLKSSSMCPVYGLAEASLAVSMSDLENEVLFMSLKREELSVGKSIRIVEGKEDSIDFVNVGRPIDKCGLRITDDQDIALEDSSVGHVQIQGDNVTRGYYNNAVATNNAITSDGWVRTGDLGFVRNGEFFITGRFKDIIFSNGQNYYPHDIERMAQELEGIELNKIAVAGFMNDKTQAEEVVAFVMYRGAIEKFVPIAQALHTLISGGIGLELNKILPSRDMPKTTSGKLQRYKLIERLKTGFFADVEDALYQLKQRSETTQGIVDQTKMTLEDRLHVLIQEVVGGNLDQHKNFLENGGNSMKAAVIAMRLYKEFHLSVPIDVFFKGRTVYRLVEVIQAFRKAEYVEIPKLADKDRYMLSPSQKGIFYIWYTSQNSIAYNTPFAFSIEKTLDCDRINLCVQKLILRHDTLRTVFHFDKDPYFTILDNLPFKMGNVTCDPSTLNETLTSLVKPFDIGKVPLFRVTLITLTDNRQFLFVDFHHIISDGTSVFVFLQELLTFYAEKPLPEAPTQYKDYASWTNKNIQSPAIAGQEKFWLDQLSGELPALDMPLDFPRPVVFAPIGGKLFFDIDEQTTQKLKNLAGVNGCTLHAVLYTIYHLLLAKYTGRDDIIIGVPTAGRQHPDVLNTHGMFVNNLAIRSTIESRKETFTNLLQRQAQGLLEALKNQDYPFQSLIEKIGGTRDVSRNPIFDTMFIFQNMEYGGIFDGEVGLRPRFFDPGFSKFDISFEFFEQKSTLSYGVEYCTELFKKETIQNLATHFNNLIGSVLRAPDVAIDELSLMGDDEYLENIEGFNQTKKPYPDGKTISQLFEDQCAKTRDSIALEVDEHRYTYQELDDLASNLASNLMLNEGDPNCTVGIMLPRSSAFIVSVFGILKFGGAYVPMEIDSPDERLGYIISDSKCKMIITNEEGALRMKNILKNNSTGILPTIIEFDKQELVGKIRERVQYVQDPDRVAYVIYTSGSSGQPKGVAVRHQSLVNYTTWAADNYVNNELTSFPLFTSIAFDLSITSIFVPLTTGNKIIIYEDQDTSLLLDQVISDNKVDAIKLTPSHLALLKDRTAPIPEGKSKICKLIVGGEQLDTQLALSIYKKFGERVKIFNEYGPTEATVGCMIHNFSPSETNRAVPIGRPINNTQIYVLDESLNPMPNNVKGRLYVAGAGLAAGYVGNADLTGTKFIPNPFVQNERMYDTGDIVRRCHNGDVEFVGREDDQVKIDGYRIEPGEIEFHLSEYQDIDSAVIVISTNKEGRKYLNAYYTRSDSTATQIEESILHDHLSRVLPYYMIPMRFTHVEKMPLTANGKVDFSQLPIPGQNHDRTTSLKPQSEFEKTSLVIWKEILKENHLTVTDNFFEYGGDSIKAVQITSRLYDEGIALNVKDILTFRTIHQISLHGQIGFTTSRYHQGIVSGEILLSPIQAWFFDMKFVNPNFYNQSVLLTLNKPVNLELLEEAFRRLIVTHDALRLNYDSNKNVLFYNNELIENSFKIAKCVVDNLGAEEEVQFFDGLKSSMNIKSDLLLRAGVVLIDEQPVQLMVTVHHLIVDGISWRILLEDLYNIYLSLEQNGTIKMPRKTASLIDWNNGLLEYSKEGVSDQEIAYWKEIMEYDFTIPLDFKEPDWAITNRRTITKDLDEELTTSLLKDIHQIYKIDIPIVLNLAIALTLQEWIGRTDFILEQENHGRHLDSIDTSRTVGWLTTMYPVKIELKSGNLENQIKEVKEQIRTVPNQGIGFGIYRYIHKTQPRKSDEKAQIRVNYLGQFDREFNNDLFSFENNGSGSDTDVRNSMTAVLEINAMVVDDVFRLMLSYNNTAHESTTGTFLAEQTISNIKKVLNHILSEENIHFTPSDFSAVDLDESDLEAIFD